MIKNRLRNWIKSDLRDFYWEFYGNLIRNPRCLGHPKSFLFVCRGNICRSPFAEHVARKVATAQGIFFSAGLEVSQPSSPPQEAVQAAESFGIRLKGHRSRRISREMIESFDMIIAMETRQFRALKKSFPKCQNKVFLLPLFDNKGCAREDGFFRYNIQDPYGQSLNDFYTCFQRIKSCIEGLFEEMEVVRR